MQRHIVAIANEDGGVEVYPLKEWLRQHPEYIPPGLDPTSSTSHQLRSGLVKQGWAMQETPSEIRLIKPGASSAEIVEEVLGSDVSDSLEGGEVQPFFSLEYQLRDFLSSNLNVISIN